MTDGGPSSSDKERELTDDSDDFTITVEEDVEPSEDVIDVEALIEENDDWDRELLRELGASEDEIDEVLRSMETGTEQSGGRDD